MLEKILRLYVASQAGGASTPVPHLFGPPGSGKSTMVATAAKMLDVSLYTINVSRISPLDLEGIQMPNKSHTALSLLTATYWTQLKDGDILLLDEFLRGFPEVYNGLLDILTARKVGDYVLPNVFIIAASNTTVAYDAALSDRLLHLPVPDPRHDKKEKSRLAQLLVEQTGLLPEIVNSMEMTELLDAVVLPTYAVMDANGRKGAVLNAPSTTGVDELAQMSLRKLIGMTLLREVHCPELKALIEYNNNLALRKNLAQYVVILEPGRADPKYIKDAVKLKNNIAKLSDLQVRNLALNIQLLEMYEASKEGTVDDDAIFDAVV